MARRLATELAPTQTGSMLGQGLTSQPAGNNANVYDVLKQLIAFKGLGDLKNISKYSSAAELVGSLSPEAKMTAEQKNRAAALEPAKKTINELEQMSLKRPNIFARYGEKFSLEKLGGEFASPKAMDLNSKYWILRQNVVRYLNGARMSDDDVRLAQNYVPTILDSPENAKVKLRNLKLMLGGVDTGQVQPGQLGSYLNQSRPPLESFLK